MPQVNELSWFYTNIIFVMFIFFMIILFSYIPHSSIISSAPFIKFSKINFLI